MAEIEVAAFDQGGGESMDSVASGTERIDPNAVWQNRVTKELGFLVSTEGCLAGEERMRCGRKEVIWPLAEIEVWGQKGEEKNGTV